MTRSYAFATPLQLQMHCAPRLKFCVAPKRNPRRASSYTQKQRTPVLNRARQAVQPTDPREDQWAPENLGFLHVATITGAHGVKGELKARTEGDFTPVRLSTKKNAQQRYLLLPGRRYPRPINLVAGRQASQNKAWIVKLDGYSSRESVDKLRGARLYVRESDRPSLESGEFMVADLVGSRVSLFASVDDDDPWYTAEGRETSKAVCAANPIGVVDSVITRDDLCLASGGGAAGAAVASDLIEIALFDVSDQQVEDGIHSEPPPEEAQRVLVPFVNQIVPVVDVRNAVIVLDPPDGLLDIAVVNRKRKQKPPRGLLMPAAQNTVINANEV
ncbi:putative 16S rRNA-processing protein RimM [Gracilariopsis chorda]|uniref:Putative 16S rRNA-processing protein RimM n=1 Tax=Gracilariopsis chorda TaxID=448386 RepID=A0A2V3IU96_9FLOR|nr:putative 16S rRNA-processing protein RimM [Gracilariopsis chorda]|eukprot:PXF45681.1 putative 16S rRNA-processing protein RimM [Gracilariopsis chorda]